MRGRGRAAAAAGAGAGPSTARTTLTSPIGWQRSWRGKKASISNSRSGPTGRSSSTGIRIVSGISTDYPCSLGGCRLVATLSTVAKSFLAYSIVAIHGLARMF